MTKMFFLAPMNPFIFIGRNMRGSGSGGPDGPPPVGAIIFLLLLLICSIALCLYVTGGYP